MGFQFVFIGFSKRVVRICLADRVLPETPEIGWWLIILKRVFLSLGISLKILQPLS